MKDQDLEKKFLEPALSIDNMDRFYVRYSILNAMKEVLPKLNGKVLDLGCGEKPYRYLIENNIYKECQYLGIDILNPLYQSQTYPDLFWDGHNIPLANETVNHIIATEVFEHVPDLLPVLSETYRVLKPGGLIFFTVPFLWPIHDAPNDEYRYTPFSLERITKEAGFTNITIKALGGWNASLAQMIGLWSRRSPMSDELRDKFSAQLFPLYQYLINNDKIPNQLTSEMYTGLCGKAEKPFSSAFHDLLSSQ
jgi:SAM-dependent methyltransferase